MYAFFLMFVVDVFNTVSGYVRMQSGRLVIITLQLDFYPSPYFGSFPLGSVSHAKRLRFKIYSLSAGIYIPKLA